MGFKLLVRYVCEPCAKTVKGKYLFVLASLGTNKYLSKGLI